MLYEFCKKILSRYNATPDEWDEFLAIAEEDECRALLKEALLVFNTLPNRKISGLESRTTYALASKIEDVLR